MMIKEADRLQTVTTYYFAQKLAEIADLNRKESTQIINLGIGSPDLLPPSEVIELLNESSQTIDANKYQSYRGTSELRSSFAHSYKDHFDVTVNQDTEILPLAGSKEGIMHLHMSILNPGDEVLVPDPGYPAYRMTAALAGATVRFYDLKDENKWLPDLEAIGESSLENVKIMWINYPHMPTGAKASIKFFEELVAFGKKNNILICHDNPYAFILNEHPVSILQVEGALDTCIELTSLSKCYNMAGWRIGAMATNQHLINTVLKFKSNMDSGMYKPLQLAASRALSMGIHWIESLNEVYISRKMTAQKIMDELGAKYEQDQAGMFLWAKMNVDVSVAKFCDQILYGARVFITPGHIFGSNGEGYIRISLCSSQEILEEALDRIQSWKKRIA